MTEKHNSDATDRTSKEEFFCSFCGKEQGEVRKLIAGPSVNICSECLKLCFDILDDEGIQYSRPLIHYAENKNRHLRCNFCGRETTHKLLSGRYANICHHCVDVCSDIIHKHLGKNLIQHNSIQHFENKELTQEILVKMKALELLRPTALVDIKWHIEDTICRIEERTGKERDTIEFDDGGPYILS